jgi:hypothetical protein
MTTNEPKNQPHKHEESLWWLAVPPLIWVGHFLACYVTAAVWCEKMVPPEGELGVVRWVGVGYTGAALVALSVMGGRYWRRHRFEGGTAPHDEDDTRDRYRFLGFAGLLLSALCAIAITFAALPFLFITSCH